MAKYSFESYNNLGNTYETRQQNNFANNNSFVSFFSLKNDGDEAIVRFPYSSPDEFDIESIHTVHIGKQYPNISCLRTEYDPIESCSLCEKLGSSKLKMFVKLIQYVTDPVTGKVEMKPCVWTRPVGIAKNLNAYITEYGSLANMVFKIKRHGLAGSRDTTYDIIPANPAVYTPQIYVPDFSAFNSLELEGRFFYRWSPEEVAEFLETGLFPKKRTQAPARTPVPNMSTRVEPQVFTPQPQQPMQVEEQAPNLMTGVVLQAPQETTPTVEAPRTRYSY